MRNCKYTSDSVYAYLLQRTGVLYYKQSDYKTAIAYTKNAIAVIHENFNKADISQSRLIYCYSNLDIYYDALGLINEEDKVLDSCITISWQLKNVNGITINAIQKRTLHLYDLGDYHRCISQAEFGESIAKEYGFNGSDNDQRTFLLHVNALVFLKEYQKAKLLTESKIEELLKTNHPGWLGSSYGLLGIINRENGQYTDAIANFQKAFLYNSKIKHNVGCAQALNNIGFVYFEKLQDDTKAYEYYSKALKFADSTEALNILDNFASLCTKKNKFDSAQFYFQKGLHYLKPGITEKELPGLSAEYLNKGITEYLVNLVLDKGDAYLQQYRINHDEKVVQQAIEVYKSADKLSDRLRVEQSEEQSKLFWRKNTRRLYEHAIEASYLSGNNVDAFYFFEKGRAVLLNEQLKQQRALNNEDIIKQALIKKKLVQLKREAEAEKLSSARYNDIQSEIFTSNQEIDKMTHTLKNRNPLYYQSFFDSNFISIADVQNKILRGKSALLEFFNGDSAVYCIFITDKNIIVNKINKDDFEKKVNAHISYLSDPVMLNKDFAGFTKNANSLYELIFKNIPSNAARIIISPDGKYFPFESLITNTIISTPAYFLNDHIVSYTYSARYLMNDFNHDSTSSSGNFLGMSPVQFAAAFHLASLNESDHSINTIASYFGNTKSLVEQQASKNNFLQQFYDYKIIQLYTHSSDSSSNGDPVIYFADSALYLSDLIAETKPATQLIVLSACETGNGKLYQGEGVFSFNRGFAALGIPSSVTNLWSVDNESTYKLTELFYKYVAKGLPLDEALQKAKLEFIQTSAGEKLLPYYWAASILAGKTDAIELKKDRPWKYIVAAIILVILIFLGSKIRNRSDRKIRYQKILLEDVN